MSSDFSLENSHQENVKIAIEKILGQKTGLKRKKKTSDDQKRILFSEIIVNIMEAEDRESIMNEAFSIDMVKHNALFFDTIDALLKLLFNKEQINLINFYMYERISPEGDMLELVDLEGNELKLDTTDDLWYLLKNLENGNQ